MLGVDEVFRGHFSYTFALSGAVTQVSFTSNDNEGVGNEFYAIDNVVATGDPSAVSAAPEPSTWALMIAGLGAIGLAFRQGGRRRGFAFTRVLPA